MQVFRRPSKKHPASPLRGIMTRTQLPSSEFQRTWIRPLTFVEMPRPERFVWNQGQLTQASLLTHYEDLTPESRRWFTAHAQQ